VALLEAAMHIGPSGGAICDHIHLHEGQAGVRRLLGVLSLAKKHGPAVVEALGKKQLVVCDLLKRNPARSFGGVIDFAYDDAASPTSLESADTKPITKPGCAAA
jgi:hypothetical protein